MSKTLTLTEAAARRLYPGASGEFKTLLEENFSKEVFTGKITDRVKSIEDAFNELGIVMDTVISDSCSKDETAYRKLKIGAKALNEGWTPNWDDKNEPKYYPWFEYSKGGFSLAGVGGCYQRSHVGSRLCFRTRELAEHAAKAFSQEYNDFLLP